MEGIDREHHSDGLFLSGGRWRQAMMDLTGESYRHQIDAWVRMAGGKEGYWQDLGGGDALTRENFTGAQSGLRRPESGKDTLPRPSGGCGGVLRSGGEVLELEEAWGLYL